MEMTEKYSLIYKKNIIRELLRQVKERQDLLKSKLDKNSREFWNWEQSERNALITVLEILNDDLSCLDEETLDNAEKMTNKEVNKMAKNYQIENHRGILTKE